MQRPVVDQPGPTVTLPVIEGWMVHMKSNRPTVRKVKEYDWFVCRSPEASMAVRDVQLCVAPS